MNKRWWWQNRVRYTRKDGGKGETRDGVSVSFFSISRASVKELFKSKANRARNHQNKGGRSHSVHRQVEWVTMFVVAVEMRVRFPAQSHRTFTNTHTQTLHSKKNRFRSHSNKTSTKFGKLMKAKARPRMNSSWNNHFNPIIELLMNRFSNGIF